MTPANRLLRAARETFMEAAVFDPDTGDFHFTVDEVLRIRGALNLACEAQADAELAAASPYLAIAVAGARAIAREHR